MKDFWSLGIFVLLLFAIVLLVLLHYFSKGYEGFIAFNYGSNQLDLSIVPTYSPNVKVCLLYDNLYFDTNNGNLIQVLGSAYDSASPNVDIFGNSVSSVVVTTRNLEITTNVITTKLDASNNITNTDSTQSKIKSMNSSGAFAQWIYNSYGLYSNSTDKYQVLYVAWKKYTFIDVINVTTTPNTLKCCALFGESSPMKQIPSVNNQLNLTSPSKSYSTDLQDLKSIKAGFYGNTSVFQILSFLYFDTNNGNLLFVNNKSSPYTLNSYITRDKTIQTSYNKNNISSYYKNTQFNVYTFKFDPSNADPILSSSLSNSAGDAPYFIYYVANQKNTFVIVLQKNTNSSMSSLNPFTILQVARFDENGYISPSDFSNNDDNDDYSENGDDNGKDDGYDDDYKYLNNGYDDDGSGYGNKKIDKDSVDALLAAFLLREQLDYLNTNYIPKSQLVPPVFPVIQSCSSCNGKGECSSCGNQKNKNENWDDYDDNSEYLGDNGDKNKNDNSNNNNNNNNDNSAASSAASFGNNLVNATTGLVNNVVNDATNLVTSAGSGTVGLVEYAGNGIGSGATSVVNGAVGLGQSTVGGAVDLTKQAVSGTAGAIGSVGNAFGIGQSAHSVSPSAPPGSTNTTASTSTSTASPYYMQTGYQAPNNIVYNPQQPQPYFMQPGYTTLPINYVNKAAPGVDGYSYYGVLPNTATSDFMPLTASFSAFGK